MLLSPCSAFCTEIYMISAQNVKTCKEIFSFIKIHMRPQHIKKVLTLFSEYRTGLCKITDLTKATQAAAPTVLHWKKFFHPARAVLKNLLVTPTESRRSCMGTGEPWDYVREKMCLCLSRAQPWWLHCGCFSAAGTGALRESWTEQTRDQDHRQWLFRARTTLEWLTDSAESPVFNPVEHVWQSPLHMTGKSGRKSFNPGVQSTSCRVLMRLYSLPKVLQLSCQCCSSLKGSKLLFSCCSYRVVNILYWWGVNECKFKSAVLSTFFKIGEVVWILSEYSEYPSWDS